MRMPWSKPKPDQLELLDADSDAARGDAGMSSPHDHTARSSRTATKGNDGHPLVVPLDRIAEDANNPRTEFPDAEIDELADDIRQRGILQPLVVHPVDAQGRYRLHFGDKRLRAARLASGSRARVDPWRQATRHRSLGWRRARHSRRDRTGSRAPETPCALRIDDRCAVRTKGWPSPSRRHHETETGKCRRVCGLPARVRR
ncbi:MAG: ParB N-terminal domain-containing protein [Ideonella sp.]|nr:ParB N-terminal domain-containing protein [Ideonella sp.]MCC7455603.1 ParB N-terminal domain-containing protein [Nitrospira sp.]